MNNKQELYIDLEVSKPEINTFKATKQIKKIIQMVKNYPNDASLGEAIRKLINNKYNEQSN
jgi:hypothetical protein